MDYLKALGRLTVRAHNRFWWEVAYLLRLVDLHRAIMAEVNRGR
ncbi:hypothetical protein QDW38_gp40 [Microbacterium phage Lynlen]|nr:hypothetical protein QDW38_gp40 [Microbacterium phage Lynlen]YP_010753536.1 hypothetical protein QDW39_gp40 [Microbacterium phage Kenzers]QJD53449.1 hypothetical protein SEA_LYNLEN_40 [Microbacterium phage Lynlen]UVT31669.1 hypothetical protein SEA_KENZERS_40 [Microbacterium phage Kenzers]